MHSSFFCFRSLNPRRLAPRFPILLILTLALAACKPEAPPKPLGTIEQEGELVVLTRNSPTTYYENAEGNAAGLEHDLVALFAREQGLKVRFVVAKRFEKIIPTLAQHRAHMAAAGLTITDERKKKIVFGPPYQLVQQQVIYNTASPRPTSVKDLIGKQIGVIAGSSYVEELKILRKSNPLLIWTEVKKKESEDLLAELAEGKWDAVVVDSNIFDVANNFYTNLRVAFPIGKPQQLAWAFPKETDPAFLAKVDEFFKRIIKDGTLKQLLERYYGHVKRLQDADIAGILDKMRSTLPTYRPMFHQAQEITGLDWRLIAALGYQESHWNPLATSPTGVRGLMMLTEDTADRMGVSNRLDPKQSIPAGAKYLVLLKDTLPARITEPDRTWLALAAYNSGYGHLEDARILAQRHKLNPDSWADVKKVMPLLSRSEYHTTLKHGFARGGESVIFVENIRTYYDILAKFEDPYRPFLTIDVVGDNFSSEQVPGALPSLMP